MSLKAPGGTSYVYFSGNSGSTVTSVAGGGSWATAVNGTYVSNVPSCVAYA